MLYLLPAFCVCFSLFTMLLNGKWYNEIACLYDSWDCNLLHCSMNNMTIDFVLLFLWIINLLIKCICNKLFKNNYAETQCGWFISWINHTVFLSALICLCCWFACNRSTMFYLKMLHLFQTTTCTWSNGVWYYWCR